MNLLHAERKPFLAPINEETKHEGDNWLAKGERPPQKILKITENNCLPAVPCHQGLFPELTPRPVDELPPPPKIDKYKLARFLTDKAIRELKTAIIAFLSRHTDIYIFVSLRDVAVRDCHDEWLLDLYDKRIFTICGPYPVIRTALRKRGWVERKYTHRSDTQDRKDEGNETERDTVGRVESKTTLREEDSRFANPNDIHDIMSRLVKNEETSFYWTIKKDAVDYSNLHFDQMLNHYARTSSFTTKIGLCLHMRNLPWYASANPNSFFPRCYGICMEDEREDFIDDFRKTAASSILKWVVNLHVSGNKYDWTSTESSDKEDATEAQDPDVKKVKELPGEMVEMACKVCETYLGQIEHNDIDTDIETVPVLSENEWNQLIEQYYTLIHEDAVISNADSYFLQCQNILRKIMLVNPQEDMNGLHNIWIIKPGAKSRGREIICKNRLDEILKLVEPTDQLQLKDHKWVVQKYIEVPLLIYETKFDIRQWFLVTDWNPLTLWIYKESYLRFSTQRFSLDNLHSSIHLCNNSIQKNYKNASDRSSHLPYHNMWTCGKFQDYLQKKGLGHIWRNVIYPSMKRILIYTMKMAQEHVEPRKSSFELYGADFILGHDYKPWLIEINSSPTMYPSTPITSDLCTKVQEDTIKVVIDRKIDRNCDIGHFELLWKQPMLDMPFSPADLIVEGVNVKQLKKHMVPISNFNFLEPLLKATKPTTNQENTGNVVASLIDKQKLKSGNNISYTLPKALKKLQEKTLKVRSIHKKSIKTIDFPRIVDGPEAIAFSEKKKTKTIKVSSSHQLGSDVVAAFPRSHALDWALLQPSKDTGLQNMNKKTPCLICGDGFQPEKACKLCSSFCATVLQGGSYLPMSSCSSPEKMAKPRLNAPYYGSPKYF